MFLVQNQYESTIVHVHVHVHNGFTEVVMKKKPAKKDVRLIVMVTREMRDELVRLGNAENDPRIGYAEIVRRAIEKYLEAK